jgi:uncharacterized membrane protein
MKNYFKKEWVFLALLVIPFIAAAVLWDRFPAIVPIHWNFSGKVDNYAPKEVGLLLIPGLNVLLYLLFLAIPRIDPRWESYKLFKKSYSLIRLVIHSFLLALFIIVMLASMGMTLDVGFLVKYLVILLMLVIGFAMRDVKLNYFVGIRTPWTLSSEEVWNATHIFGSKIWIIASLIMLVLGLLIEDSIYNILFFIFIGIIAIVPVLYSYIKFRAIKKDEKK